MFSFHTAMINGLIIRHLLIYGCATTDVKVYCRAMFIVGQRWTRGSVGSLVGQSNLLQILVVGLLLAEAYLKRISNNPIQSPHP